MKKLSKVFVVLVAVVGLFFATSEVNAVQKGRQTLSVAKKTASKKASVKKAPVKKVQSSASVLKTTFTVNGRTLDTTLETSNDDIFSVFSVVSSEEIVPVSTKVRLSGGRFTVAGHFKGNRKAVIQNAKQNKWFVSICLTDNDPKNDASEIVTALLLK